MCYLISYTRLFTKLNLFIILLYVTFLTTKFSRSTVYRSCIIECDQDTAINFMKHVFLIFTIGFSDGTVESALSDTTHGGACALSPPLRLTISISG